MSALMNFLALTMIAGVLIICRSAGAEPDQCAALFARPLATSSWVAQHVMGLDTLTPEQVRVLADFVRPLKRRFAKLPKEARLHVIPSEKAITDHELFGAYKGLRAEDVQPALRGTPWGQVLHEHCRGLTNGCHVGVGREQFKDVLVGEKHTAIHELGHLLHFHMRPTEREYIQRLYKNAKANNLFLDPYSSATTYEYFAEALETYVAEYRDPQKVDAYFLNQTRANLKARDPQMYTFLKNLLRGKKQGTKALSRL